MPGRGADESMTSLLAPLRPRRSAVVALLDQAVSSLANFLLLFFAARSLDVAGFGIFSLVYVSYVVLLGAAQSFVGQELVLLDKSRQSLLIAEKSSIRFTLRASGILGALLLILSIAFHADWAFFVLAVGLPLLLTNETLRYTASVSRTPQLALLGDSLWLVVLIAGVAAHEAGVFVLSTSLQVSILWLVAVTASVVPMWLVSSPKYRGIRALPSRYLRRKFLGFRFVTEYLMVRATGQASILVLGFIATVAASGALRGISTLFGPVNVLFNAMAAFGVPIVRDLGKHRRTASLLALSSAFALLSIALTVFLLLIPDAWGRQILGDTWANIGDLILATGIQFAAMSFGVMGYTAIRFEWPTSTLYLRTIASVLLIALFFGGYAVAGVQGVVWGQAIASTLQAVISWSFFAYKSRTSPPRPKTTSTPPS